MPQKYEGLNALIQQDPMAKRYFDSLPDYVKAHMATRDHNINSLESLKDYAENITRGDC